jgi:ferredoxin-NADP reductase
MKLRLTSKKEEVANVITFAFTPDKEFTWEAGQYMHYVLPHENADDRGDERWFTISSAPFEKEIHITTRNSGDKGSSFKKNLFSLDIGAEVESDGPEGDFTVTDPSKPFVFIAGGIGITPFRSILLDLDKKEVSITGTLLYANRDTNIVFKDELDNLASKHPGFTIKYIINPDQVDGLYIRKEIPDLQTPIFYISGPKPMVLALEQTLKEMDIAEDHIKLDDFPGYEWPHQ